MREANSRVWTDGDRVCGGCRRTQPGLILLFEMPKDICIRMGEGCGALCEKAHPSLQVHLLPLQLMGTCARASASVATEWGVGKKKTYS